MNTLLLEYRLKVHDITRTALLEVMGWSEGTRQARCIRGENWTVEEVRTLLRIGFTFDEIRSIFFTVDGSKTNQEGDNRCAE